MACTPSVRTVAMPGPMIGTRLRRFAAHSAASTNGLPDVPAGTPAPPLVTVDGDPVGFSGAAPVGVGNTLVPPPVPPPVPPVPPAGTIRPPGCNVGKIPV